MGEKGRAVGCGPHAQLQGPRNGTSEAGYAEAPASPPSPRGGEEELASLVTAATQMTWWSLECAQADNQSPVLPKQSESVIVRPRRKALPFEPEGRKCKDWDQLTVP